MQTFKDYDSLWIQSIPSIATIFYHKYLSNTHILYCPDEESTPQTPRTIERRIRDLIDDSNNKKVAIYFLTPCNEIKKTTIIKLILKKKSGLSSYSLSLPSTIFQTNLLLGWSAEINDPVWQRRCKVQFDPEAFNFFEPPTTVSGQSDNFEFLREFVISKKKFSKKSLIVDLTSDMITFDIDTGIKFKHCVDLSIKGWMRAANGTPSTLIWIIDEKELYGENISLVKQDQRASTLRKYRDKLFSSVQEFATTTPIYCYLINPFTIIPFHLSNYLAQIQHRHHLCMSKTILLKRCRKEKFGSRYLGNKKAVYLNAFPTYTDSKWESIYLRYFNDLKDNDDDNIRYISPEILNVNDSTFNYCTPMLTEDGQNDLLTISESIGIDDNLHTVSAQSSDVFDKWATLIREASVTDEDIDTVTVKAESVFKSESIIENKVESVFKSESVIENKAVIKDEAIVKNEAIIKNEVVIEDKPIIKIESTPLFDKIISSLTVDLIKDYINDENVFEQGTDTISTLFDAEYSTWKNKKVILSAKAKGRSEKVYLISMTIDQNMTIIHAVCSCFTGTEGHCRHCAAMLLHLMQNASDFSPFSDCDVSSSGSESSLAKKRSFEESQEEDTDDTNDRKPEKKGKCVEDTTSDVKPPSTDDDNKDQKSGNSSSMNSNSVSTLPSIPSSVYCSTSSRSYQSITSFPTLPSSGSLEANNNSTGSSAPSSSVHYSTIQFSSVGESFVTQEYSADDEEDQPGSRERRQTQYVTAQGTLEDATQYYDPNNSGRSDEAENPVIDLDDSDDEDLTQPYDANEMPTQPYNAEARESDDEKATQPYNSQESETQ